MGIKLYYGIIMTPATTYILRDDFTAPGPEAIQLTHRLPTVKLLSRLCAPLKDSMSDFELERIAQQWLERLTESYHEVLPDDPDIVQALFPDIVGAIAGGRVVAEMAA